MWRKPLSRRYGSRRVALSHAIARRPIASALLLLIAIFGSCHCSRSDCAIAAK